MATTLEEIGTELQHVMRYYEEVVSDSCEYVQRIRDGASRNIKDQKAVDNLYALLRDAASCHYKLFDLTRKYLKQVGSINNSD